MNFGLTNRYPNSENCALLTTRRKKGSTWRVPRQFESKIGDFLRSFYGKIRAFHLKKCCKMPEKAGFREEKQVYHKKTAIVTWNQWTWHLFFTMQTRLSRFWPQYRIWVVNVKTTNQYWQTENAEAVILWINVAPPVQRADVFRPRKHARLFRQGKINSI